MYEFSFFMTAAAPNILNDLKELFDHYSKRFKYHIISMLIFSKVIAFFYARLAGSIMHAGPLCGANFT